jgi:L-alanine-DL-glutamate epimerase-like enolase superfamily enzyme
MYVEPDAWAGSERLEPVRGKMAIPQRPGIGFEPDMQVLERYASK